MTTTKPNTPWQNRSEQGVKEAKRKVVMLRHKNVAPRKMQDYVIVYAEELKYFTAFPNSNVRGKMPREVLTGNEPNILPCLDFEWYDPCWYLNTIYFP